MFVSEQMRCPMAVYHDHIHAIKCAMSVSARNLYQASSWQQKASDGWREERIGRPQGGDRQEHFEQDCMTSAFLMHRLPNSQWSILWVKHAPPIYDVHSQEFSLLMIAAWAVADSLSYPRRDFARWATLHWADKNTGKRKNWDWWKGSDLPVRTAQRHYGEQIKPTLDRMEDAALENARILMADTGMIASRSA